MRIRLLHAPSPHQRRCRDPRHQAGRLSLSADRWHGLYLKLFVKDGSHGWRVDYSFKAKRNILSLGTYPDVGLAAARRKADEVRAMVSDGVDPSAVRKADKSEVIKQRIDEARADGGLAPIGSFEVLVQAPDVGRCHPDFGFRRKCCR